MRHWRQISGMCKQRLVQAHHVVVYSPSTNEELPFSPDPSECAGSFKEFLFMWFSDIYDITEWENVCLSRGSLTLVLARNHRIINQRGDLGVLHWQKEYCLPITVILKKSWSHKVSRNVSTSTFCWQQVFCLSPWRLSLGKKNTELPDFYS